MRSVEVTRLLPASPEAVTELLEPESVVELEGAYVPRDVLGEEGRTVVSVWPGGRMLAPRYLFEERPDGFVYRRLGEGRDVVTTETTVTIEPADGGTRITLRSTVETSPSLSVLERVAAWQRRRRISRLVDRVAARIDGSRTPDEIDA